MPWSWVWTILGILFRYGPSAYTAVREAWALLHQLHDGGHIGDAGFLAMRGDLKTALGAARQGEWQHMMRLRARLDELYKEITPPADGAKGL